MLICRGPCHEKAMGALVLLLPPAFKGMYSQPAPLFVQGWRSNTAVAAWKLLLLATTGYDAQTHADCSPHHGPALPRQHTAYHPLSPLEIWHHPTSLMLRWPEHPSKGVAPWDVNARNVWLKGWMLITHKQDCGFFFSSSLVPADRSRCIQW